MKYAITTQQLAQKALEIAEANPNFVYEPPVETGNCQYVHGGGDGDVAVPGCLFGQAFYALGVPLRKLAPFENRPLTSVLALLRGEVPPLVTEHVINLAQVAQDAGQPWGSESILAPLREAAVA